MSDNDLFLIFLGQTPMHLQRQLAIISSLEHDNAVKCFPNWNMAWHFDDKVSQQLLLERHKLPVIPARVFWDKELALEWAEAAQYPQVFKLKGGAGSLNVLKVKSVNQAMILIKQMFRRGIVSGRVPGVGLMSVFRGSHTTLFKSYLKKGLQGFGLRYSTNDNWDKHRGYAYFQEFLPGNEYDTRVTVIGNRAFGFIRYNRPNDFRSSGSGNIDFAPKKVDKRMIKTAFDVSTILSFSTMAYDFLYDSEGKPVINEMCCQFADWAVYTCPGYWDRDLNWHEGHFWPQYSQLCYLLGDDKLIQPDFSLYDNKPHLIKVHKDEDSIHH